MQPTGRRGAGSARAEGSPSALWNVGLCGRGIEGLQLMRMSLGSTHVAPPGAKGDEVCAAFGGAADLAAVERAAVLVRFEQ
jgi:hypothetical protein